VHQCMILMTVLVLAIVVGVGLVQLWVDHPVFVRESLYFDYAEAYPTAVFYFGDHAGGCKKHQVEAVKWVFQLATHFMFLRHF
jgi:hypothetical protein